MGLNTWLRARAAVAPFVVTAPGGTCVRLAVEREIREHGLCQVSSPAAADLLVVAGPAHEEFDSYVTRAFDSMPLPRDRVWISEPDAAATEIGAAIVRLRAGAAAVSPLSGPESVDGPHHQHNRASGHDAEQAPVHEQAAVHEQMQPAAGHEHTGHAAEHEHVEHAAEPEHMGHAAEHEHVERAAEHEHMEHAAGGAEHGGHDHDMGMMMPGGLAMADRAADRDGLKLDVLTVPLGPVLAWWPAGLTVVTRWQGDIVCDAAVSVLAAPSGMSFWLEPWLRAGSVDADERRRWRAARALDSASTLLIVAGWSDAATTARRLRDELLVGDLSWAGEVRLRRWARRVAGSWVLRWSLRDVGRIAEGPGVPAGLVGDVHDRLLRWIAETDLARRHEEKPTEPDGFIGAQIARCQWIVDTLPTLLAGTELAEARLIVASLDPDIEVLTAAVSEVAHG
ncbi:hypothetical protein [Nocardia fluminea]|uniref:Uncharacterized protein n=1 Tax=Nocardia fluminea TaxID=134984 RepID=A0A2N3VH79_9NOCA|nr:hypothetical protein [Nocardia fluminea]PKV80963.1 hypothetical protein ATK86_5403 [Nocardia fluminea]